MTRDDLVWRFPARTFELRTIVTTGDVAKDVSFGSINLKGVFTKELDEALLARSVDLAVHSLKDLPSEMPAGIALAAVTPCLDPRDAVVSRDGTKLKDLPAGAKVGTSSLRRRSLLRAMRTDLAIELLRGNVDTRLRKLDEGRYDAILLAAAGLKRLGYEGRITELLDPFEFVPAIGQGMLAVTARAGDGEVADIVRALDDPAAHRLADAERRFMARMEGGCQVPIGCHGEVRDGRVRLKAFLSMPDASRSLVREAEGALADATGLADGLADWILRNGGREILREIQAT
jgi:hydroxymethylbilane synthase